jgi:hypothetical protein
MNTRRESSVRHHRGHVRHHRGHIIHHRGHIIHHRGQACDSAILQLVLRLNSLSIFSANLPVSRSLTLLAA